MREILVVCPQPRDPRPGAWGRYRVRHGGRDLDLVDAEPAALLEELSAAQVDGVVGTKDRSALLASLVARRLGLPGPSPEAIVRCQHKPTSRTIQRAVAPEETPASAVLVGEPPFPGPWFVKPVVGRLSQEARRVDERAGLAAIAEASGYRDRYGDVARLAGLDPDAVHGFLVEQLAEGAEVTLEAYVRDGAMTTIGVTDSVKYPGTSSFERFEYPSALPAERLSELDDVSRRLVAAHDLDDCFLNVEFLVPDRGPVQIVEINPRIASQFSPLVEAVHGRSTYDALLALACGDDPRWENGKGRGVAVSYVVRVFEDALVESVPDRQNGVEILVAPGRLLSEQGTNDSASFRLAIFTEWGETREEAIRRSRLRAESLTFELAVPGPRRELR